MGVMKKRLRTAETAAALTAAALALAAVPAAGRITSYGAVYTYEDLYSWSSGADEEEYDEEYEDSFSSKDQDVWNGPGVVLDDSSTTDGVPSVSQVTLSEKYHSDYQIYEESMAGLFFFYVNVENGGITHEPVSFDIPANLNYTVEKDGLPWEYAAGQPISARGTYVMKLWGIEDTSLPLSEQKEYKAVFRFRIQEKPPEETTAAAQNAAPTTGYGTQTPVVISSQEVMEQQRAERAASAEAESAAAAESVQELPEETESSAAAEEAANGGAEGEAADGAADPEAEAGSEEADGTAVGIPAGAGTAVRTTALSQEYIPTVGKYQVAFRNGLTMVVNVPEGYIGPGPVDISLSDEQAEEAMLYLNDELIEHTNSIRLEQEGYYRLDAGDSSWSFAICTATGSLDIYPAPVGMKFTEISLDGEAVKPVSGSYALLEENGQYHFVLTGEAGEKRDISLKKDTTAPEVSVSIGGGTAVIQYLSDDISTILLEKNGEPVEGFRGNSVTTPGSYRLIVTDNAGNESSVSFNLKYQVNKYGIAAVVLIILVLIGGAVFVIHTKKTVKIR